MVHTIAIAAHAALAVLGLLAAVHTWRTGRGRSLVGGSLAGMTVALTFAVPAGWSDLEPATQIAYPALLLLAVVMTAKGLRVARGAGQVRHRDREDLGFLVIGLLDGFAVVTAFRAGVPGWALVILGVGTAVAGHLVLSALQRRLVAAT